MKKQSNIDYLISNGYKPMRVPLPDGRIITTSYYIKSDGTCCRMTRNGLQIMTYVPDKDGYDRQMYYVAGKPRMLFRHRLIAFNFCKRKRGKNIVNHKDFDKTNNNSDNLEWCTVQENSDWTKMNPTKRQHWPDFPFTQLAKVDDTTYRIVQKYSSRLFLPKQFNRSYVRKNLMGWSKSHHNYTFVYTHQLMSWARNNGYKIIY